MRVSALASWNDGAAKSALLDFVARVTTPVLEMAQRQNWITVSVRSDWKNVFGGKFESPHECSRDR